MRGFCKFNDKCNFVHNQNFCKKYYMGKCFNTMCNKLHNFKPLIKKKLIKKNTISFKPDYTPPDMRIIIGDENKTFFNRDHSYSDIVLVKNLFKEEKNMIFIIVY